MLSWQQKLALYPSLVPRPLPEFISKWPEHVHYIYNSKSRLLSFLTTRDRPSSKFFVSTVISIDALTAIQLPSSVYKTLRIFKTYKLSVNMYTTHLTLTVHAMVPSCLLFMFRDSIIIQNVVSCISNT